MNIIRTANSEQLADILGIVVDDYLQRRTQGEQPEIEHYVRQHPELADVIRALEVVGDSLSSGGAVAHNTDFGREKRLGDFHILHELGRGGMGIVYEAEQISMGGRKVALKVLPFAAMVDEKRLQRFRNEVRAAASLDHPNIVSVYSVGEERGVHFYAMQLIRGQSLAAVIDQLRELRQQQHPLSASSLSDFLSASANGQPSSAGNDATQLFRSGSQEESDQSDAPTGSRSPTSDTVPGAQGLISTKGNPRRSEFFRSVAELGIQAAEALDHAHQQGVIHRDIKPANLMIDAPAKLYITDFGLAQMEENVGVTMTGDLIGTLRYMSPEQVLGKRVAIDHRADIYALGISLHELLTTEPVFDGENRAALIKQIAFQEPRRLRQIDRTIPLDLETIIHKAVTKNPDERYSSAQELANDLKAFRDDQPITARPPSIVDRSRKWAYRNQGLVLATAVVMLLTTIGLGISSLLLAQQRNVSERLRRQADANFQRAQTEAAIAAAVTEFINTDLLGSADPLTEPNRELKVRDVLDRAARRIESRFEGQPLVAAAIRRTLGNIASALGEYDQAERHLKSAKQLYQQQLGNDHPDLLLIEKDLASLYFRRGDRERSADLLQSLVERSSRMRGTEDAISLNAWSTIALFFGEVGRYRDAEKLAREVLDDRRRVLGSEHRDTLQSMANLASGIGDQGRFAEAEKLMREVLDIQRLVLGSEHPRTLANMHNLASVIGNQGRYAEAEKLYREVLDIQRRVLGPEHPDTLITMTNLTDAIYSQARAIGDQARYAEAEKLHREVLDIQRRVFGPEHPGTLITMGNLARAIRDQARLAEAEKLNREVLDIKRRVLGPEHPDTLASMSTLAVSIDAQGRHAEAVKLYREVLDSERRVLGPEHPNTLASMHNLAYAINQLRRYAEAEQLIREVLDMKRRVLGPEHPSTLDCVRLRAMIISNWSWELATDADPGRRDPKKAAELAREATQLWPDRANLWNNLGVARYRAGQWQASVESLEKADSMIPTGDRAHRMFLAMAHWQLGNQEIARKRYTQGAAWIDANRKDAAEQVRFCEEAEQLMGLSELDRNGLVAAYYAKTDVGDPKQLSERGLWYQSHGEQQQAIDDFNAALGLQPETKDLILWRSRGIAYFELKRYDEALKDFAKALEIKPNDARSLTMRAAAYSGLGQFDLALADRTKVIELEPATNHRYFERADVYRALGKFDLALADIEQGFATDAVKDAARFPRARAYALRGDIYAEELQKYDLAIKAYEQAIELEPNNASYANKLESAAKAILRLN